MYAPNRERITWNVSLELYDFLPVAIIFCVFVLYLILICLMVYKFAPFMYLPMSIHSAFLDKLFENLLHMSRIYLKIINKHLQHKTENER